MSPFAICDLAPCGAAVGSEWVGTGTLWPSESEAQLGLEFVLCCVHVLACYVVTGPVLLTASLLRRALVGQPP